ncbi:hypothetical protein [Arthrobacter nitrophenolicus]|uniref:Uncharacterized protein n=1 Tax=Arthrobacter nitrophenolicus TaxID=683150 RepID=A0A4R5XQK9_9MICC|nr:hypothetical protein [Arthrobacter nitrophenolicus]TDL33222.1 hypothetical protein E2R57_18640 [Arthrobacter nitrophenolicus]
MIDLAGLIAAAVLLFTLIALEVQFVGQDTTQPVRPRLLGLKVSRKVVIVMWAVFLLLVVPRVWELIT